jgi:hypothetical protein
MRRRPPLAAATRPASTNAAGPKRFEPRGRPSSGTAPGYHGWDLGRIAAESVSSPGRRSAARPFRGLPGGQDVTPQTNAKHYCAKLTVTVEQQAPRFFLRPAPVAIAFLLRQLPCWSGGPPSVLGLIKPAHQLRVASASTSLPHGTSFPRSRYGLSAELELVPVMNVDDLGQGCPQASVSAPGRGLFIRRLSQAHRSKARDLNQFESPHPKRRNGGRGFFGSPDRSGKR